MNAKEFALTLEAAYLEGHLRTEAADLIAAHDASIRAEALRDAADRAVEWLNNPFVFDVTYGNKEEQADASLRAAILAGEVDE